MLFGVTEEVLFLSSLMYKVSMERTPKRWRCSGLAASDE